MKNRILAMAIAGALSLARGLTLPPMGNQTNDPRPPRYRRGGHSVAQGKRMAAKRRNQLRAKGHYKQAVR